MNLDLARDDPFSSEGHSLTGPTVVFNALTAALIVVYEETTRELTMSVLATGFSKVAPFFSGA